MFTNKIKFLVAIIYLLKIGLTNSLISLNNLECTIKNSKFSNEYLFKDILGQNNQTFDDSINKPNVYLYPLKKIKNLETIIWKFIKIKDESNSSDIYFIKTVSNDEFLCGSNRINHRLQIKHKFHPIKESFVFTTQKATKSMRKNNLIDCKWKLKESISNSVSTSNKTIRYFNISNMNGGNNFLYASSGFFQSGDYKRNVYLWHKASKSDSFKWNIDCSFNFFQEFIE